MPLDAPPLFTIEEANALVPRLARLVAQQMDRRAQIERRLHRLNAVLGLFPSAIRVEAADSPEVRELKEDLIEQIETYHAAWREIEDLGGVLKDADAGLVDFYGQVDGKHVWLCWKYGEQAVTHYHALDEGFSGRKPIEPTVRNRQLN